MTFYSNSYIRNVLHSDTAKLRAPKRKDTLYIKAKALQANRILDNAFSATEPVILKAKTPLISVKKETIEPDDVNGGKKYDEYLLPTYNVVINKAYDNFNYLFTAYADDKGNLIFRKSNQFMMPEFKESTISTMKGITDGYLKHYLTVWPGKTLGIPHTSIVLFNVSGIKIKGK